MVVGIHLLEISLDRLHLRRKIFIAHLDPQEILGKPALGVDSSPLWSREREFPWLELYNLMSIS